MRADVSPSLFTVAGSIMEDYEALAAALFDWELMGEEQATEVC